LIEPLARTMCRRNASIFAFGNFSELSLVSRLHWKRWSGDLKNLVKAQRSELSRQRKDGAAVVAQSNRSCRRFLGPAVIVDVAMIGTDFVLSRRPQRWGCCFRPRNSYGLNSRLCVRQTHRDVENAKLAAPTSRWKLAGHKSFVFFVYARQSRAVVLRHRRRLSLCDQLRGTWCSGFF